MPAEILETTPRRALVTGAAGGLGREVAIQLAARRCAVAIADINAEGAAETARLVREKGAEAETIVDDFTREGAPEAAVEKVVARWGGIDILVNNAGYGVIEPFLDATYKSWTRTLALNVTALAMACKAAGRVMREQRSGRIINIGALGALKAGAGMGPDAASKSGVHRLTETLAAELKGKVTVNAVLPSTIDTPANRRDMPKADFSSWVTPQELASVILFLASPEASAVTGALIPVSGRV